MGILERVATKSSFSLPARALIGRSGVCAVRVEDPHASAEHASVYWTGVHWEVKDLGSSNGTTLDGRKLHPGEPAALREGSELRIAGDPWILTSAFPPTACAKNKSGVVRVAEDRLLDLPDSTAPLASAYEDATGVWWIEVGEESRRAVDQETIVAGEPWVLSIPRTPAESVPQTEKLSSAITLANVTLRLGVSSNEEHVELSVLYEEKPPKKSARAFHYVLLTLARERVRDAERGAAPSEQGWVYVAELLKMLGTEAEQLNVAICRARKELASYFGITDAGTIVERRPASRQIRIGCERLQIVKI